MVTIFRDKKIDQEALVSIDDAALILSCSKSFLYKHLATGRISSVRFNQRGKHKFFPSKLLEEWSSVTQEDQKE